MARKQKIAVTVDRELLGRVEALRSRTGESRSAVVGRALAALTEQVRHREAVERYVAAYREKPETDAEVELAGSLARQTLVAVSWDDE